MAQAQREIFFPTLNFQAKKSLQRCASWQEYIKSKISVLYFPGDDRAKDASEVVKDVADAALTSANELPETDLSFHWKSEDFDKRLTFGLRVLKNMESLGIYLLNKRGQKQS